MKLSTFFKTSVLLAIIGVLAACNHAVVPKDYTSTNDRKMVTIEGLQVYLKAGVPSNIFAFEGADYREIAQRSLSMRAVENSDFMPITMDELAKTAESIIVNNNYPQYLDELSESDVPIILNDFPELKDYKDILNHQAVVRKVYQIQGTYQILEKIRTNQTLRYSGYLGTALNKDEFWLLARYFWKINGTKKASQLAFSYEQSKYGNNGWLDKGDAFRHAIWNVLIAKYTDGTKAQRAEWAQRFTDAHEYGSPTPDTPLDNPMDYHNNAVGRNYWNQVVSGSWWRFNIPSDATIIDDIYIYGHL